MDTGAAAGPAAAFTLPVPFATDTMSAMLASNSLLSPPPLPLLLLLLLLRPLPLLPLPLVPAPAPPPCVRVFVPTPSAQRSAVLRWCVSCVTKGQPWCSLSCGAGIEKRICRHEWGVYEWRFPSRPYLHAPASISPDQQNVSMHSYVLVATHHALCIHSSRSTPKDAQQTKNKAMQKTKVRRRTSAGYCTHAAGQTRVHPSALWALV